MKVARKSFASIPHPKRLDLPVALDKSLLDPLLLPHVVLLVVLLASRRSSWIAYPS